MAPTGSKQQTADGMLRAIPLHLARPQKHRRRTNHRPHSPAPRPTSPLALPPMSSPDPDPDKDQDPGPGTAGVVVIEPERTSFAEKPVSPDSPSNPALNERMAALEDKIKAVLTTLSAVEKKTEVLREHLASLDGRLVALENVTRTSAPSPQRTIVDEVHKIILISQTVLLAYIHTYVLGPVQRLKP